MNIGSSKLSGYVRNIKKIYDALEKGFNPSHADVADCPNA